MDTSSQLTDLFGTLKNYFRTTQKQFPGVQPILNAIDQVGKTPFRTGKDGQILQDAAHDSATWVLLQIAYEGIVAGGERNHDLKKAIDGALPVAQNIKSLLGLKGRSASAQAENPAASLWYPRI